MAETALKIDFNYQCFHLLKFTQNFCENVEICAFFQIADSENFCK